jgi:hypothetical protein
MQLTAGQSRRKRSLPHQIELDRQRVLLRAIDANNITEIAKLPM